MARTYRTISLSLPPEAVEQLEMIGKPDDKTAGRIAAEIVLRGLGLPTIREPKTNGISARVTHLEKRLAVVESAVRSISDRTR